MNRELYEYLMEFSDLESRAYELVYLVFASHTDKAGDCYLSHLERVRDRFSDSFCRIVALLHDVVEDSTVTGICFSDLEKLGFCGSYIEVLTLLTKEEKENYPEYISRIIDSKNKAALLVKIADMEDNLSDVRLMKLNEKWRNHFLDKYSSQIIRLLEAKGEMELC